MGEISIDRQLELASGILSDVETIDLPWSELETAGFDWCNFVGPIKRLRATLDEMNTLQKARFEELRVRTNAVKDKLKALDLENPFE